MALSGYNPYKWRYGPLLTTGLPGPTLYAWSPVKTAAGVAPVQQTPAASVPVATSSPAEAPKKSGEQSHGQKKEADLESLLDVPGS